MDVLKPYKVIDFQFAPDSLRVTHVVVVVSVAGHCYLYFPCYLPAKEEEPEKGNCSKDMQRLAIRKLHRRTPGHGGVIKV